MTRPGHNQKSMKPPAQRVNKYAGLDTFCANHPEDARQAVQDALADACEALQGCPSQIKVEIEPCETGRDKMPRSKLRISIQPGTWDDPHCPHNEKEQD